MGIIIWGGKGQTVVLEEIIRRLGCQVEVIVDNDESVQSPLTHVKIVYKLSGLKKYLTGTNAKRVSFAVAIGGEKGRDRCEIGACLEGEQLLPVTLIHQRANVSDTAVLARGCQVLAGSTVGAGVSIGKYSIINTGAVIAQECSLGDGVHIGPGATLAGLVKIGNFSFVGAGAVILPRIRIGNDTIIGAGSTVTKDVPDNEIWMGTPAAYYRKNE